MTTVWMARRRGRRAKGSPFARRCVSPRHILMSLSLFGGAFAQELESASPQQQLAQLPLDLKTTDVQIGIRDAVLLQRPQSIAIIPSGPAGPEKSQTCTVVTGTKCSILVPQETSGVSIDVNGTTKQVELVPTDSQLNVELMAPPDFQQKVWWALGGDLKGNIESFSAEAAGMSAGIE